MNHTLTVPGRIQKGILTGLDYDSALQDSYYSEPDGPGRYSKLISRSQIISCPSDSFIRLSQTHFSEIVNYLTNWKYTYAACATNVWLVQS